MKYKRCDLDRKLVLMVQSLRTGVNYVNWAKKLWPVVCNQNQRKKQNKNLHLDTYKV